MKKEIIKLIEGCSDLKKIELIYYFSIKMLKCGKKKGKI